MGLIAECDGGCGTTTDDLANFKEFGVVKKVWYCKDCQADLDALYKSRDELHTLHAIDLEKNLLERLAVFRRANAKGKLPDAPE
jgi:hypothetical protein